MRYTRSEALALDTQQYVQEQEYAPSFVALDGRGLDARARGGVSAGFGRMVMRAVACAVVLFSLGCISIALTWGTVSRLQEIELVSSQIVEIEAQNGDLRMECARMSRAERVALIATQNYGMEYANDAERLEVGSR